MFQQLRSELATAMATMEQRMTMATKREIGTLTTRDELDVSMSRQKQEILEQMQQQRDEQTTTFNESVNQMYDKWTKSK